MIYFIGEFLELCSHKCKCLVRFQFPWTAVIGHFQSTVVLWYLLGGRSHLTTLFSTVISPESDWFIFGSLQINPSRCSLLLQLTSLVQLIPLTGKHDILRRPHLYLGREKVGSCRYYPVRAQSVHSHIQLSPSSLYSINTYWNANIHYLFTPHSYAVVYPIYKSAEYSLPPAIIKIQSPQRRQEKWWLVWFLLARWLPEHNHTDGLFIALSASASTSEEYILHAGIYYFSH